MISKDLRQRYKVTVGIECHVQLKTKTKLFSGADNDAREAPPNSLVNHIDFGLPGALPVLNQEAITLAARAAFALNSTPQLFSKFDRKHYFYPDLPMGYQITQYDEPIILGGHVDFVVDSHPKSVRITRAHLESDAGKSTHLTGQNYSLVDLNRAGTPLLEIVSEPDMHSSEEAKAYARELWLLMRYAGVSYANLYYGNMRFDVNVSVSKNDSLGTRTETKNLNSFRSVERAIDYEVDRQIDLIEKGNQVVQETRGWDEAKQKSFSQRTKENADDYRYMPDPDIPPIVLEADWVQKIKADMPLLPGQWRDQLRSLNLTQPSIETLLEAEIDHADIDYLELIAQFNQQPPLAKFLANWFVNLEIPLRVSGTKLHLANQDRAQAYEAVYKLSRAGLLSSTNVKALLSSLLQAQNLPDDIEAYVGNQGLLQLSDQTALEDIVKDVLGANPKAASDIQNGETKAIGFLVGQVMKQSQGKANPAIAGQIIRKQLGV